jgi:hypothetical protein
LSLSLILFFAFIGVLLLGLIWAAWGVRKHRNVLADPRKLEVESRRHATFLPQIRQALAKEDDEFLSSRASRKVHRRAKRERRTVALAYLEALRGDFQNLLDIGKAIALLSPEVVAIQEFERIRLTTAFFIRYELIRFKLRAGFAPIPQLDGLSDLVSGLSVRMDAAIKELGERAADLASSMNRRSVDAV